MKRIFAMLLVFTLLSGCLFSYAEDIASEVLSVIVEDGADESVEECDAVIVEEGLLLGEGNVESEDSEWVLDLENGEGQYLLDLVDEQDPMASGIVENGIVQNDQQGTFTVENGVLTEWNSDNTVAVLTIPENLGITEIGKGCFQDQKGLQIVILPSTVTTIGEKAFQGCIGLQQISMSDRLQTIGGGAFSGCAGLRVVSIPSKVTIIDSGAFGSCTALREVFIESSVLETIGSYAFNDCTSLKSINIPSSVKKINSHAFYNTNSLMSVELGNNLTYLGEAAFANSGINSIRIPGSLKSMTNTEWPDRSGTFQGCVNLETVEIDKGLTYIGEKAFKGCSSLKKVTISSSVTEIGKNAFADCVGLNDVEIQGGNLKRINEGAFDSCISLKSMVLPNSVTSIGSSAFARTSSLEKINLGTSVTSLPYGVFHGSGIKSISIPGSVSVVDFCSFQSCERLETVILGNGVTTIGYYAFEHCTSLKNIAISNSVTEIGICAFSGCTSLERITIPRSVNIFRESDIWSSDLFKNCSSLKVIFVYKDSLALQYCIDNNLPYEIIENVAVKSITIDPVELQMNAGKTATLTAIVKPDNATNKSVLWKSSDTGVATVEDGKVKAVKTGTAVITCISMDDVSKTAKCKVVVGGDSIAVTGVTISRSSLSLGVGGSATLSASVQPATATDKGITWSSSDSAVATVSSSGVVRAVAKGTAIITATSVSDISKKAACTVTVASDAVLATSIALDRPEVTLKVGETATLLRTILPADVTAAKGGYQISDKAVFEVSAAKNTGNTCKYTIKAVGVGTAKLTVSTMDGTKLSASCTVNVIPDVPEKRLTKTGSNGTVKVEKGGKLQLAASFASQKGWKIKSISSSNKKVAAVTSAGLVTAKKAGTATITVKTKNGKKATVKIKVIDPKLPTKVTLNKTGTVKLKKGNTLQLEATVLPDTAETALTWKSSNKKIATVSSSGLVKAKKKGAATITVKTKNGKTAKVKIKVVK